VNVANPSEVLNLSTNESYELSVSTAGDAVLTAPTIFGAMRGMETFFQLVTAATDSTLRVNDVPIHVSDTPRFAWRGLLMDTARHYLPTSTLKASIDGLAASKMNVLHWHVVDAQSFPFNSASVPELVQGAYAAPLTYTPSDVLEVVQYGLARGVRVIPEFDIPGHAYSWGIGLPWITTSCPPYEHNVNNIPLDPTQDHTYEIVEKLLTEVQGLFSDDFIHLGGDEVVTGCWKDNANVSAWLAKHGKSVSDLVPYFVKQVDTFVTGTLNRTVVHWEEVFEAGATVPANTVFQVWKSHTELASVVQAGHRAILSNSDAWYLSTPPGQVFKSWEQVYANEPFEGASLTPAQEALVLGGEVAMWDEYGDAQNVLPMIWPRAMAAGERLWSAQNVTDTDLAFPRLHAHRCRMVSRGLPAMPLGPGFCEREYL
jgi:hexosaminidase